ncbi:DUF3828 domain-containing protein [Devosia salina]|uniref:DUF3828 domain-containing protein n=1 Tax=Devosia salina TaxID=2860336 RepID=A0ABX8WCV6_9HYPH|nr:DUF3828 domain-containing protein [Devosia salina]QYO75399.1 DUF3828 domain-containing protein [Devosia salina]
MRAVLLALAALTAVAPAQAAPIPVFDDPRALLVAVYEQIEASEDWENFDADSAFAETDAFSARLSALLKSADETVMAGGDEIGALDFSPFINGQDSGGMDFAIGDAKTKGGQAVVAVDISYDGQAWQSLTFLLIDEGAAGWKVDDVVLPFTDVGSTWRLSDYLADPLGFW